MTDKHIIIGDDFPIRCGALVRSGEYWLIGCCTESAGKRLGAALFLAALNPSIDDDGNFYFAQTPFVLKESGQPGTVTLIFIRKSFMPRNVLRIILESSKVGVVPDGDTDIVILAENDVHSRLLMNLFAQLNDGKMKFASTVGDS